MSILVCNTKHLQPDINFPLIRQVSLFVSGALCGCCSFGRCDPISKHKPMRAREFAHVVDGPEQHVVGLGDSGWEGSSPFVGHDHPQLELDTCHPETTCQDSEQRKQGQSVKVSSDGPGRTETRYCRTASSVCAWPEVRTERRPDHRARSHRGARDSRRPTALSDCGPGSCCSSARRTSPPPIPTRCRPCRRR